MSIKLVPRGALIELRECGINFLAVDTDRVVEVDFLAVDAHSAPTFSCDQEDWLSLSLDDGVVYDPVPGDGNGNARNGLAIGALAAGERRAALLKIHLPPDTERRLARVGLYIGEGA